MGSCRSTLQPSEERLVLREMMDACPESVQLKTKQRISILHLAVSSNSLGTVKSLLERMGRVEMALNDKDEQGNTVLHLATARRQVEIVKFLVSQPKITVNEVNRAQQTALNLLQTLPKQKEDLLIEKAIRAVGGHRASGDGRGTPLSPPKINHGFLRRFYKRMKSLLFLSSNDDQLESADLLENQERNQKVGTLIVVATLIATITFQAGLSPPGGVYSFSDLKAASPSDEGVALGRALHRNIAFIAFDVIGLFASVSTILLFICCASRLSDLMLEILSWFIWIAVLSTALAFTVAAILIFGRPKCLEWLLMSWFLLLGVFVFWIVLKIDKFAYKKAKLFIRRKWGNALQNSGPATGMLISVFKYVAFISILGVQLAIYVYCNKITVEELMFVD